MSKTHEVKEILRKQEITSWFQPIVDVENSALLGWEAFSKGPMTGEFKNTPALFDSAAEAGVLKPFDLMCLHSAASCFEQLQLDQKLFVHLTNEMLVASGRLKERVNNLIADNPIPPTRMVLEIDERSYLQNIEALLEASHGFKEQGFQLAIDNLELGTTAHSIWAELKPDFVKIDRRYVRNIHNHPTHQNFIRHIASRARAIQAKVIAEGVETLEEFNSLKAMGVQFVQGYLIQRPQLAPSAPALDALLPSTADTPNHTYLACDLVVTQNKIDASAKISEVLSTFEDKVFLSSLAVVEQERVVGLVHRAPFLALLSKKQRRNVLLELPISAEMETDFLSVDAFAQVEQVSRLVTARARIHSEHDFVITSGEKFLGLSNAIELLRKMTRLKVGASRQADLLTLLPGSIPLGNCVNDLLEQGQAFTVALLDLTDFKTYNNHYGHSKGDEILVLFADMLRKHISETIGFIGHIGGDDFIVVIRHDDWQKILASLLTEFDHRVIAAYHEKDQAQGGIQSTDHFGDDSFFPFLSISGGAISLTDEYFESFQALLTTLIQLKQRTKRYDTLRFAHQQKDEIRLYSFSDGKFGLES